MNVLILVLTETLLLTSYARAGTLNLENYLGQVKSQNQTIKANELNTQSFKLRVGEASLDFMPFAIGAANYSDDKRIGSLNTVLGSEAINEAADVGVQQK